MQNNLHWTVSVTVMCVMSNEEREREINLDSRFIPRIIIVATYFYHGFEVNRSSENNKVRRKHQREHFLALSKHAKPNMRFI